MNNNPDPKILRLIGGKRALTKYLGAKNIQGAPGEVSFTYTPQEGCPADSCCIEKGSKCYLVQTWFRGEGSHIERTLYTEADLKDHFGMILRFEGTLV